MSKKGRTAALSIGDAMVISRQNSLGWRSHLSLVPSSHARGLLTYLTYSSAISGDRSLHLPSTFRARVL